MSFLALTHSIFIFFKRAFHISIQQKISKKIMFNMKFFKIFYWGPYSDFSDIKSSIRDRMDDFNFFFAIYLLSENATISGGRLADF